MLVANIEGDELVMQTATSIARRNYTVKLTSGGVYPLGRKYLTEGGRFSQHEVEKAMLKLKKVKNVDYTIECDITYGEIGLAVYLMENQLRKIRAITECGRTDIWLGPSNGSNFRFASAKTQPYKSNRGEKPPIVTELREYLKNVHGAMEIEGYEADDALGIYQKDNTIAVHCDKDIFMIPGKHLNTMTDQILDVTDPGEIHLEKTSIKGTGLAFFFAQMLLGDSTDTIPNLVRGYGPAKVFKLLQNCVTELDYFKIVQETFKKELGLGYEERLLEQADLVYICRNRQQKGRDYIKGLLA